MRKCKHCGREFEPVPHNALICSDACRKRRARIFKRTYRRKTIGQLAEERYRQTPRAKAKACERAKRHARKKANVLSFVELYERKLERLRRRSSR
jgi:hypothetical protein